MSAKLQEVVGERRHLTVLFSDLVGSTEISAHLDPEEFRELVAEYQAAAADAITQFGGNVAKYLGDGVMAYFGWPEAHDNDAERAARAGLAIVDAINKVNVRKGESSRFGLSVRVGIDSGIVVIGRSGSSQSEIFGDAANIAARIQAAAEPDCVLVSAAAHRLISGLFVVEAVGPYRLKGIAEPIDLFRIVRLSGARSRLAASAARGLSQFIGREEELRFLINRWSRACDGEGQVVLIVGEAGIGKSRLVLQFRQQLATTPHTWNECAGAPYFQNTPFHPIIEMLEQGLAQRGEPSNEAKLSELERDLEVAGLRLAEAVPLIAQILNIDVGDKYTPLLLPPEQQRKRLLAILAGWLFGSSRQQTTVMTIEDLHWFDASSLELIQLLLEQGATSPLLLLCTARPEFRAPWTLRAHHSQITLNRLSTHDVRELVANVMAQTSLSGDAVDKVVQRTGGVPLFVEELTRAVVERGDSQLVTSEIPDTLHDSLMARLDRLGPAKEIAQIASVIGAEFSYELLHAVASIDHDDDIQASLKKLTDSELIYARGIPPEATYSFKHALVRDTAYEALLKSRRRELHKRIAATLTENSPRIADAKLEVVARHWTAAQEVERAVAAWRKIGEASVERWAFDEAEQAYRSAIDILKTTPDSTERDAQELELSNTLVQVLTLARGYSAFETIEAVAHTRALAEKSGNLAELVLQVFEIWAAVNTQGDFRRATVLADQLRDLAEREGSHNSLAFAHQAQMQVQFYAGNPAGTEEHFALLNRYLEGARRTPGLLTIAIGYASLCAWAMGRADLARERIASAIASAQETQNPYDLAFGRFFESWLYLWLKEPRRTEAAASEVIAISEKHGFPYCIHLARHCLGWARAELGSTSEGILMIQQAMAGMAAVGAGVSITGFLGCLAEAQFLDGKIDDAMGTIENALNANPEELAYRPHLLTLRGNLRLKLRHAELAETDFRKAIGLAQKMRAKSYELRAAVSLASMLRSRDNVAEGRKLLQPLCASFTEGLDTADLKEANALLIELGA